ncbi:hypothetical protein FNV43_RR23606 [Rhamnella rubrinervis]|uniref:Uncharacterized protein n=1 Tax=Rhamnella rubrinervis TaxID=2594499 RepID=A0A8K0DYF2_9ROSA|nr:hypothetical protein FNV43_RR23606 [Rhamnella rubrinervis]
MATEKGNAEVSDTHSVSNQDNSIEQTHFGKALAHRAVYGSRSRSGGRSRTNDAKTQPSRLSKVSLAAEQEKN